MVPAIAMLNQNIFSFSHYLRGASGVGMLGKYVEGKLECSGTVASASPFQCGEPDSNHVLHVKPLFHSILLHFT